MYDVSNKSVSHLSGELSAKFVDVAEENAATQDENGRPIAEQIDRIDEGVDSSDIIETVVDLNGTPVSDEKGDNQVLINSGYSVIKSE